MKQDKFNHYVSWAFYGIICFLATRLVISVDTLNVEIAKVTVLVGQHEKRLDKLEK